MPGSNIVPGEKILQQLEEYIRLHPNFLRRAHEVLERLSPPSANAEDPPTLVAVAPASRRATGDTPQPVQREPTPSSTRVSTNTEALSEGITDDDLLAAISNRQDEGGISPGILPLEHQSQDLISRVTGEHGGISSSRESTPRQSRDEGLGIEGHVAGRLAKRRRLSDGSNFVDSQPPSASSTPRRRNSKKDSAPATRRRTRIAAREEEILPILQDFCVREVLTDESEGMAIESGVEEANQRVVVGVAHARPCAQTVADFCTVSADELNRRAHAYYQELLSTQAETRTLQGRPADILSFAQEDAMLFTNLLFGQFFNGMVDRIKKLITAYERTTQARQHQGMVERASQAALVSEYPPLVQRIFRTISDVSLTATPGPPALTKYRALVNHIKLSREHNELVLCLQGPEEDETRTQILDAMKREGITQGQGRRFASLVTEFLSKVTGSTHQRISDMCRTAEPFLAAEKAFKKEELRMLLPHGLLDATRKKGVSKATLAVAKWYEQVKDLPLPQLCDMLSPYVYLPIMFGYRLPITKSFVMVDRKAVFNTIHASISGYLKATGLTIEPPSYTYGDHSHLALRVKQWCHTLVPAKRKSAEAGEAVGPITRSHARRRSRMVEGDSTDDDSGISSPVPSSPDVPPIRRAERRRAASARDPIGPRDAGYVGGDADGDADGDVDGDTDGGGV